MLIKATRSGILLLAVCIFIIFVFGLSSFSSDAFPKPDYSAARQWTSDTVSSWTGKAGDEKHFDDTLSAANPVADVEAIMASPGSDALPSNSDASSHKVEQIPPQTSKSSHKSAADPDLAAYNQLFSQTTLDGKYFPVKFANIPSMNPNFIPHPTLPDTWYMVAQRWKGPHDIQTWFTELVCEASFKDDVLQCLNPPTILPVAVTTAEKCQGDTTGWFGLSIGPHDARVFYGPDRPFMIYGSSSAYTCFGLWAQDFRMLVSSNSTPGMDDGFRFATDLQRPPPVGDVEKNWFMFWDSDNQTYLHYDIAPHRVFAKLNKDGSVGPDLGSTTQTADDACIKAHTPAIAADNNDESLHQATNSLAVTMCKRSDPACKRSKDNTFILHIFQHKTFYGGHAVYEPYVMLYRESAPFGLHGISSKPIWITGRKKIGQLQNIPKEQSELIYVTSVNWKAAGNNYHGYLDDVVMLGFGVEDSTSGGIDVVVEELIGPLSLCST